MKLNTYLSTCPLQANTAVFEACSKERIQPFDDDEEDIWEEKEINFATQTKSRNRSVSTDFLSIMLWNIPFSIIPEVA